MKGQKITKAFVIDKGPVTKHKLGNMTIELPANLSPEDVERRLNKFAAKLETRHTDYKTKNKKKDEPEITELD